jgi:hypothetical protein
MPRGQNEHTRIGTFACLSNPAAPPKQAKEPTFPARDKRPISNRQLNSSKLNFPRQQCFRLIDKLGQEDRSFRGEFSHNGEVFSTQTIGAKKGNFNLSLRVSSTRTSSFSTDEDSMRIYKKLNRHDRNRAK